MTIFEGMTPRDCAVLFACMLLVFAWLLAVAGAYLDHLDSDGDPDEQ